MGLTCEVLAGLGEVAAVAPHWEALLDRSPCNRAFSSPAWFLAEHEADPALSPRVLTAWRGSGLVGVLPLTVREGEDRAAFAPLSDYNDVVAEAGDLDAQTALLAAACPGGLALRRIRHDSNLARALAMLIPGLELDRLQECPFIRLGTSFEEYAATRRPKWCQDLRRMESRAAQCGAVVRELVPESFPPGELSDLFLSLHASRFGEESVFARSAVHRPFARHALPRLFSQGRLRAFALYLEERAVAVQLCMVGAASLAPWNGGFLPEAAHLSPIKLLFRAEIAAALASGLAELDLLRGGAFYKVRWANGCRYLGALDLW